MVCTLLHASMRSLSGTSSSPVAALAALPSFGSSIRLGGLFKIAPCAETAHRRRRHGSIVSQGLLRAREWRCEGGRTSASRFSHPPIPRMRQKHRTTSNRACLLREENSLESISQLISRKRSFMVFGVRDPQTSAGVTWIERDVVSLNLL